MDSIKICVPTTWKRRVKSARLHALSLALSRARYCMASIQNQAAATLAPCPLLNVSSLLTCTNSMAKDVVTAPPVLPEDLPESKGNASSSPPCEAL